MTTPMRSTASQTSGSFTRDDGALVARFCPRCLRSDDVEQHTTLCRTCGDTLQPRGYCPICESFVNQAVGALCVKHDVPLEAAADEPWSIEYASRKWVTLQTYAARGAAEGLRIRLEAEGIPTFLDGERMGSAAMYEVATGGVKLQVPEDSLDEARILASQVWSPPVDDPDDLENAWDDLAPDPGALFRSVMELMAIVPAMLGALVLLGVVIASLVLWFVG